MPSPSLAVTLSFVLVVLAVVAVLIGFAARVAGRRGAVIAAVALAAWLAFTAFLGRSGAIADFAPVPAPLLRLVFASAVLTIAVAASPLGRRLARDLPLTWLVGFQGFRVAVELVLARLHHEGITPVQMTFEGYNFDILSGASAIALAAVAARRPVSRGVVLAWSVAGSALLANIVTIAILSAPVPFRAFHEGPANTVVTGFPFVWLPTVLVMAALFGHVLVFRRIAIERREQRSDWRPASLRA
jgi:hypothetical protein